MRNWKLALSLAALSVLSGHASAQQLGSYGNVWEIREPDGIDTLKGTLRSMERNGKMQEFWNGYRDRALNGIENPEPLPGISRVAAPRTWTFDPTYTYPETVRDNLGNVIVPAGTRLNPLDYTQLSKSIIFIDGRDPVQVAFAKAKSDANPRDKVVLVAGSFLKLNREWKRVVFFDQQGILTKHFGIKRVPAVLSQKGKLLQIEEIVPGRAGAAVAAK
jgi:conjugal transfer pilus assembly protein TraW